MKHIKTTALAAILALTGIDAVAQPPARRAQQQAAAQQKKTAANTQLTTRAQISYPVAQQLREDVVWRRDIYREIDLAQGENAGLYYPVEPVDGKTNLFTYLFKLVLSGRLKAYEYTLDGNESFAESKVVKPLTLLDNYHIYYERKDGKLHLDNSDIPSREVKGYYIKESAFFDQVTSSFHNRVVALCPIMSREDDFGDSAQKYPLFWVKYSDAAPFLTKLSLMTSDTNNAATMTADDFFTKNMYRGKIYKTNNRLGQTLAQYCPTDTAMAREQKRIEKELADFEKNIWGDPVRRDSLDSIAKAEAANPKAAKKARKANRRSGSTAQEQTTTVKKSSSSRSSSSSSGSGAARVTVRRQRH